MAYTKQTWHDLPQTDTPVNATRLNHIEDGIESVEQEIPQVVNVASESTTDTYSCDYVNTKLNGKVDTITVSLSANASYTFNSSTRGTYIITTTSNSSSTRSCYLVLTRNSGADIINLVPDTGSAISVTSTGSTITISNTGYGTNLTIITLTEV